MAVVAYTDLFNECLDDLAAKIGAITGVTVVTDPRNLAPPCAFIDAPTFEAYNGNIVKMTFPVRVITLGPGNLDAQRSLMNLTAKLLGANLGLLSGRPTVAILGGTEMPAYDLQISMQAQTS
jgi:hypothetical protein